MAAKDTLLYASLCIGAVGVLYSRQLYAGTDYDIYHKYTAGDIKGLLRLSIKLNPVRLAMDLSQASVATKDIAQMRGKKSRGHLICQNKLTGPGKKAFDKMHSEMKKSRSDLKKKIYIY